MWEKKQWGCPAFRLGHLKAITVCEGNALRVVGMALGDESVSASSARGSQHGSRAVIPSRSLGETQRDPSPTLG